MTIMKSHLTFFFILNIAFFSCNKVEKTVENRLDDIKFVVEKMPDYMPNLNYIRKDDSVDAAVVFCERTTKNLKTQEIYFTGPGTDILINCKCELDSGELKIKISNNGGWMYRVLNIAISDSVQVNHFFSDDIEAKKKLPQYFRIEINDLNPNVYDTIYGSIISIHDTVYNQIESMNDTTKVDLMLTEKFFGHFRCEVK